jgi:hypothetical protein
MISSEIQWPHYPTLRNVIPTSKFRVPAMSLLPIYKKLKITSMSSSGMAWERILHKDYESKYSAEKMLVVSLKGLDAKKNW